MDTYYPSNSISYQKNNVIAISSQKGGVGKSTTVINLSSYLCYFGYRTLIIDMDPQSNATIGAGIDYSVNLKSIYDVLIANESPEKTIIRTPLKGLDILPGSWHLANFEKESHALNGKEFRLQDAVEKIKNNYNYIIIDCPASLGLLTVNSLVAAKEVIVPLQCEFFALEGIVRLIRLIDNVKREFNNNLLFKGIVLTMYNGTRLAKQVVIEINNSFPDMVFKSVIPKNISLAEASSLGKSILLHDPYSTGAIAYSSLTKEIISTNTKPAAKENPLSPIKFKDFWPSNTIPRHALKKRKYLPRHAG